MSFSRRSLFFREGDTKLREGLASLLGAHHNRPKLKTVWNSTGEFKSTDFLKDCGSKGPTFVLIKRPLSGKIIGGFTRRGWGWLQGTQYTDMEAFLFSIQQGLSNLDYFKYPAQVLPSGSGMSHIQWLHEGPRFAADLCVSQTGVSSVKTSFAITSTFIQDANFSGPFDVEVVAVWNSDWGVPEGIAHWEHDLRNLLLPTPWQLPPISWTEQERQDLMSWLAAFKPPRGLPKVNILLVGAAGAGKSSLISSVDSVFKARISRRAPHGQATSSFTRLVKEYTFKAPSLGQAAECQTDTGARPSNVDIAAPASEAALPNDIDGSEAFEDLRVSIESETPAMLPFAIWDSPGWTPQHDLAGELGYILDGNISSKIDITQPNLTSSSSYNQQPGLGDKMHVVCFVVPCDEGTNPQNMGCLHRLKKSVISRDIPTLVLLTKIDEYDSVNLVGDLTKVFHSTKIEAIVKETAGLSGVGGTKDVFPVKSFSQEIEPTIPVSILLLRALQHALYSAVDYLEDCD